ncbi:hypothetical protein ACFV4P_08080 [Kitasatospora sp. NPDC059795]|uniref:hypothetical protein n=1 Tax=Kitasatospora sp. NPDC059795 TaxID=3346949 RepID=UPI00365F74E7
MNATRTARTVFVGLLSAGIAVLIGLSSAPSSHVGGAVHAAGATVNGPVTSIKGPIEDVTWGQ